MSMEKKREQNKLKSFTFEEFKKEFLAANENKKHSNKGHLYELGAKMARDSLSECRQKQC